MTSVCSIEIHFLFTNRNTFFCSGIDENQHGFKLLENLFIYNSHTSIIYEYCRIRFTSDICHCWHSLQHDISGSSGNPVTLVHIALLELLPFWHSCHWPMLVTLESAESLSSFVGSSSVLLSLISSTFSIDVSMETETAKKKRCRLTFLRLFWINTSILNSTAFSSKR